MNFDGWARVELDIAIDGATVAPRVIVASRPMVFTSATAEIVANSRYETSYPPAVSACTVKVIAPRLDKSVPPQLPR